MAARLSQFDDAMISSLREPVTIAQLKRYMDRRFDRLERMKADKVDLRRFATKKDLGRFATKRDLQRFAKRSDLRGFVRKSDLRRFATKRDLRRFATKNEVRLWAVEIKRHFNIVAEGLDEKLQKVADGVAEVATIKLHLVHHGKVLDDHETRITAIERNP